MFDIQYNSALLTVIFAGMISFGIWDIKQHDQIRKIIMKSEKRIIKLVTSLVKEQLRVKREHRDERI